MCPSHAHIRQQISAFSLLSSFVFDLRDLVTLMNDQIPSTENTPKHLRTIQRRVLRHFRTRFPVAVAVSTSSRSGGPVSNVLALVDSVRLNY